MTHIQFNLDFQAAILLADLCWSVLDARLVDGHNATAVDLLEWHLGSGHLRLLRLLLLLILALQNLLVLAVALGSFILVLNRLVLLRVLLFLLGVFSLGSRCKPSADYAYLLFDRGREG